MELPKEAWGPGPWQEEPDRAEWKTAAGLPGLALRGPMGAWCGYVGVAPGHPWFGVHYNECIKPRCKTKKQRTSKATLGHYRQMREHAKNASERQMWQNLVRMEQSMRSWSTRSHCPWSHPRPEGEIEVHGGLTYSNECSGKICHVPAPGEPDHVWWFGFDCAHYMDYAPGMEASMDAIYALEGETRTKIPGYKDPEHYKDLAYVTVEIENLATQLAGLS